jgi:5-(carboxyamino)imidazole ribonucleotide synthase
LREWGPTERKISMARVGILGAGQLGRMLALAGYPLGIDTLLLDRDPRGPGAQVAELVVGKLDDPTALRQLIERVDVVTFDIENVRTDPLAAVSGRVPVHPSPQAVATAQDRLMEKELFRSLHIPTAPFVAVDRAQDLEEAASALGWPLVLKARRMGYDGRGQRIVPCREELSAAWQELGRVSSIAEGWIDFEREVSLIGVRGADDEQRFYPLAENTHDDGILIKTLAPYRDAELQRLGEGWLEALFERLDYRGVLTVEFFHTCDGRLVANEIAPRVHNSGHWTIEGAETSQFENHLRAILGYPLGDTRARGHSGMLNLLGRLPRTKDVLAEPGAHLHLYGKTPRPRRKLGHCTLVDTARDRLVERMASLEALVGRVQT